MSKVDLEALSVVLKDEIIKNVLESNVRFPKDGITGFLPLRGSRFEPTRDLMVVGRAVNGWELEELDFQASKANLSDPDLCEKFIDAVIDQSKTDDNCPMKWICEYWANEDKSAYNTKRSAFWRAIHQVEQRLGIYEKDVNNCWASHLVWSNLYKIAPAHGGNPSDALCEMQLEGCRKLIQAETTIFKPKRLLLLTGWLWAKDFKDILKIEECNNGQVEAVGEITYNEYTTEVVVASHPQGKPQEEWVDDVMSVFDH